MLLPRVRQTVTTFGGPDWKVYASQLFSQLGLGQRGSATAVAGSHAAATVRRLAAAAMGLMT